MYVFNNPTPILYPPGSSENVDQFAFQQSRISSTSLSFLVSFILFSSTQPYLPFSRKPTLDKDQLSNYRPISNLSLISKIIERVVKSRLTDYLSSNNNLLNPHQSAYCKHHSTETALAYIHDHLINAIGSQKISCK